MLSSSDEEEDEEVEEEGSWKGGYSRRDGGIEATNSSASLIIKSNSGLITLQIALMTSDICTAAVYCFCSKKKVTRHPKTQICGKWDSIPKRCKWSKPFKTCRHALACSRPSSICPLFQLMMALYIGQSTLHTNIMCSIPIS